MPLPEGVPVAGEPGPLDEIDALVELAGSVTEPRRWAEEALSAGLAYVTANKALLAAHGGELAELALLHDAAFLASASVGGGTPMLEVTEHLAASGRVTRLRGLLNATTTFILSAMADGRSYRDALADAQAAGYAEADPSFDVDGRDAAQKLALLAWVAWGRWLPESEVETTGHSERGRGAGSGRPARGRGFAGRSAREPDHPGRGRSAGDGGRHRVRARDPQRRGEPADRARPRRRRAGHRRRGLCRSRPAGPR